MKIIVVDDMEVRLKKFEENLKGHLVYTTLDALVPINDLCEEGAMIKNAYSYSYEVLKHGGDVYYLDHDFYELTKTGMDLVEDIIRGRLPEPRIGIIVHSANPVGARMMTQAWQRYSDKSIVHIPFAWKTPGCQLNTLLRKGEKDGR